MPGNRGAPRPLRRRYFLLLILLVGSSLSALGWWSVRRQAHSGQAARFDNLCDRIAGAVTRRLEMTEEAMVGARALIYTGERIGQREWSEYFRTVEPFIKPGLAAFAFVERVEPDRAEEFWRKAAAAGLPMTDRAPRPGRDAQHILTMIAPMEGNAALLGRNLAADDNRYEAAREAMLSGRAVLSRPVNLLLEGGQTRGMALFVPVYRSRLNVPAVEAERERDLQGWVTAGVRLQPLWDGLTNLADGQIDLEVFGDPGPDGRAVLYDSNGDLPAGFRTANHPPPRIDRDEFVREFPLPLYGRDWLLRMKVTPEFAAAGAQRLPWVVFLCGVIMTGLAAGLYWSLGSSRMKALALAEEMTRELKRATDNSRRLALVASLTKSGVIITDREGRAEWVNEAYGRNTGYTLEEMVGRKPGAVLQGSGTSPSVVAQMRAGMMSKRGFHVEVLNYHKSGRAFWAELEVQPLYDENGAFSGFMGVQTDVTERHRIEEQLRSQEALFRFIFEHSPVGISWLQGRRPESRIVNPAHERITGVPAALSKDTANYVRVSHPDERKQQQTLTDRLYRGEISEFSMEKRYVHPDGRIVWAVLTMHAHQDPTTGEVQEVTTLVDVTALKRAQTDRERQEAFLRFIFENAPMGISWFMTDDVATHVVNPEHERITGVSAEESKRPGAFVRVSHPEDYAVQQKLVTKLMDGTVQQYFMEKRYLHPDGRVVWAAFTSRLFVDPTTGRETGGDHAARHHRAQAGAGGNGAERGAVPVHLRAHAGGHLLDAGPAGGDANRQSGPRAHHGRAGGPGARHRQLPCRLTPGRPREARAAHGSVLPRGDRPGDHGEALSPPGRPHGLGGVVHVPPARLRHGRNAGGHHRGRYHRTKAGDGGTAAGQGGGGAGQPGQERVPGDDEP